MLEFQNIHVSYGKQSVLTNVHFSLTPHTITALIGRNGCGKSTLVSCINGQTPYRGQILFLGQPLSRMSLRERARKISILPQFLTSIPITVEELVTMGRNPYLDIGKRLADSDKTSIANAIEQMGISALQNKMLNRISGGERQKAYLAMILAQDTDVIVLDEPTTYMDMSYEAEFIERLQWLKSSLHKTILIVMHDLTSAIAAADNIALLDGGTISFFGTSKDCVQSGIIEQVFQVKRHSYEENGTIRTLYHSI